MQVISLSEGSALILYRRGLYTFYWYHSVQYLAMGNQLVLNIKKLRKNISIKMTLIRTLS